jgi:outer membrane protein TolC
MKAAAVIIILLGLCLAGIAQEEAKKYTLEECIEIGLEQSAAAANARRDQEISAAAVVQARSQALPHLSLRGAYNRLDELQEIPLDEESPVELGTLDNYSADITISQLLYSGGKVGAALRAAKTTRSFADWSRADTESILIKDIRVGFYDILQARAAAEVVEKSVSQLESLLAQTEERYRNGTVSEFDVITARVRLANEQPTLIQARNRYEVGTEVFKGLLNLDTASFEIEGELVCEPVNADLQDLIESALLNRPALRVLEAVGQLRKEDLAAAKSGRYPSLAAMFTYNGANSYQFVSFDNNWEWHWNAGLVLQWDLWDGGLTAGTVREKKLELAKSRTDLEEMNKAVRLEVQTAFLDMKHALEAVEAGRGNVELAEKALAIARTRHEQGMATYLEFTDSNLALSRAGLAYSQSLRDHANAVARLKYACGLDDLELHKETDK